jgi:hypothetical protein
VISRTIKIMLAQLYRNNSNLPHLHYGLMCGMASSYVLPFHN